MVENETSIDYFLNKIDAKTEKTAVLHSNSFQFLCCKFNVFLNKNPFKFDVKTLNLEFFH